MNRVYYHGAWKDDLPNILRVGLRVPKRSEKASVAHDGGDLGGESIGGIYFAKKLIDTRVYGDNAFVAARLDLSKVYMDEDSFSFDVHDRRSGEKVKDLAKRQLKRLLKQSSIRGRKELYGRVLPTAISYTKAALELHEAMAGYDVDDYKGHPDYEEVKRDLMDGMPANVLLDPEIEKVQTRARRLLKRLLMGLQQLATKADVVWVNEPVKFKGANRIISIVEFKELGWWRAPEEATMKVLYGSRRLAKGLFLK